MSKSDELVQRLKEEFVRESAEEKRRDEEEAVKRRAEAEKRREEDERRKTEQQAALAIRRSLARFGAAKPDTFEWLKLDLENVVIAELWKCGSIMDRMQEEVEKKLESVTQRIDALNEQRLREEKKASASAVIPFDDGASPEQITWLKRKLSSIENRHPPARVELGQGSLRIYGPDAEPALDEALTSSVSAAVEAVVEEVQSFVELTVEDVPHSGVEHVARHVTAPFTDQYGIRVTFASATIRVFGPPAPTRDIAAVLWTRFVEGKSTGVILISQGQFQGMPAGMKADFEKDVKDLEAEHSVEVHRGDTALWVSDARPANVSASKITDRDEAVAGATRTMQEMLMFYVPIECMFLKGLARGAVERLQQDAELRRIAARHDLVITFDAAAGTAWLCGQDRGPTRQRLDAVLTEGGFAAAPV